MPNWCYTDYKFLGNTEDVNAAAKLLKTLENTERADTAGAGQLAVSSTWLGYLRAAIGAGDVDCRGEFIRHSEVELLGWEKPSKQACLSFSTETAWGPCEELMKMFADKFNLSANWYTEEPGMGFYEVHDPDNVLAEFRWRVEYDYTVSFYANWEECLDDIREEFPDLPKNCNNASLVQCWVENYFSNSDNSSPLSIEKVRHV